MLVRLDRRQQFLACLDIQRAAEVDLAHLCHEPLGQGVGEHEERPRKAGSVQLAQLPRPQSQRAETPGRRRPPARLTRPQVHLPALHHELPLQRGQFLRL